ncbi:hypothetical protein A2J03_28135 [Rhodococcus sp. EPR-157]|jgi:hypothetical protein|uniref:hypothetical protein n=1 Tax=Rhodococcus sp. EPR-157 TaxID=1813677 RepID=UPI0007BC2FD1|nr:hypothetical protein [Rhodococcus sp. EPR-157]KZF02826.1 hypothetical protein A2J03_28135 [Rhodococcus sp. EPR-157]
MMDTATPGSLRDWWRRANRDDRGAALETVVVFGVVLLLFLIAIQAALYAHARTVAIATGEEALRQARSQFGSSAAGTAAGYAFASTAGPTTLRAPVIVVNRGLRDATVQIIGQPIRLIPFFPLDINVSETLPVERVTTPGTR